MTFVVVYVGGPAHGNVVEWEGDNPPLTIELDELRDGLVGIGRYRRRELADTPGRIAYTYDGYEAPGA